MMTKHRNQQTICRLAKQLWRSMLTAIVLLLAMPMDSIRAAEAVVVTGGQFNVEWRGEFSQAQQNTLKTWLRSVANTVAEIHGTLPRPEIKIVLQEYDGKDAVPFARVLRGREQGVMFYINPSYPLNEYVRDWTAYHELSHLFIPYPGQRDIWFSEGLASYYQNILQFRAGLLTEQEAWQKLYEGFERGRKDNRQPDLTLEELSSRLREFHAYMRVYWSGALYFLEADMRLRATTDLDLDQVLRDFGKCCLTERNNWQGIEIAAEFDRLANTRIFVPLFKQYAASLAIPDYMPTIEAAGVEVREGNIWLGPAQQNRHQL